MTGDVTSGTNPERLAKRSRHSAVHRTERKRILFRRVQRIRTRGWRMPPNTIYVGRPTRWGNPFKIGAHGSRAEVVIKYRAWLMQELAIRPDFLAPLREKNLACFCRLDVTCHADILLELANRDYLVKRSKQQSHGLGERHHGR